MLGVPIKRLHPDWCAAEALQRERFDAAVGAAQVDAAMADLLGADPRAKLNEDLGRLKALLESDARSEAHGEESGT